MSVNTAGPSLEQNYGFLRTKYGMIPRECINKVVWHNEHQDGSGNLVPSIMVFIPRFQFDRDIVIARGLGTLAEIPIDGGSLGGFWIDKYTCSQPNAKSTDPYPDIAQNAAPGIHAARSQHGVPVWDYINFDEAKLACENRGGIVTGTADSGTTNTLVDAALIVTKVNYYNGWRLSIIAGTNAGEASNVIGFNPATDTLTVDRSFTLAIDNTSQYRLTQYHLVTPEEMKALCLLSLMFGTQPHGNNDSQSTYYQGSANRDIDYNYEKGVPDPTLIWGDHDIWPRILTGTGPATFAHNHHISGVYDLNGNVWEWNDLKIGGSSDYVISEVNGNTMHPSVGATVPNSNNYCNKINSDVQLSRVLIPEIGASNITFGQDYYYVASGLRAALRGGAWTDGIYSGLFGWYLGYDPSRSYETVSFRAALAI